MPRFLAAALVLAAALAACTSSSSPSPSPPPSTATSGGSENGTSGGALAPDAAASGGQTIGAQGGAITVADVPALQGTSLVVPAGALSADVAITIAASTNAVTTGTEKAAGPVADFGPTGTKFAKSVTITLPYELPAGAAVSDLHVVAVEADGTRTELGPTSAAAGIVTFQTGSFTRFGAVVPGASGGACTIPADCTLGQSCVNGSCVAQK